MNDRQIPAGQPESPGAHAVGAAADKPLKEAAARKPGGLRFAYASGSRPLDGYTIKRGIGAGGFGEVYFAVSDGGKEVALKRIQRNLDVELRGVTQCLNLKHQNLVALFDIRHDDHGQAWVVMEYVSGESLKDLIDRHPQGIPQDRVLHWLRGIVAGVDYLHDHGIVHRDLKPGNIFLDDEVVKIGDYGLSKFISCSRRGGQTESVGTFHYMAPEIGKGVYGKEIDLYALGVMLYEMLTGRVPFDGESGQEIIMKHLTDSPRLSDVSVAFREVIAKALAKDPAGRFSSGAQMLAAVESGLAGLPPSRERQGVVGLHGAATGFAMPAPVDHRPAPVDPLAATHPGGAPPGSSPLVPPVRIQKEVLYIGDDDDEIVLGEVKEIITAEPVGEVRPHKGPVPGPRRPDGGNRSFAVGAQPVGAFSPSARGGAAAAVLPTTATGREVISISESEPIARAVHTGCCRMGTWWKAANLSTPAKLAVVAAVVVAVIFNSQWLVPAVLVAGSLYLVYFGVRSIVLAFRGQAAAPFTPRTTPAAVAGSPPRRGRRRSRQDVLRESLQKKSFGERLTEATGAMLLSAAVVAALSLLLVLVGGQSLIGSVDGWSLFAWMTITGALAAWCVLAVTKFWEGTEGDQIRRRFVMLVLGLVVGVASWGASELLLVRFSDAWDMGPALASDMISADLHNAQGGPTLAVFLAYFAGLFVILRWWLQADPLRGARFSLLATASCVFWAWVFDLVWRFPQPWGFMLAAVVSIAVQLASPWISPKAKARIHEQLQEA